MSTDFGIQEEGCPGTNSLWMLRDNINIHKVKVIYSFPLYRVQHITSALLKGQLYIPSTGIESIWQEDHWIFTEWNSLDKSNLS